MLTSSSQLMFPVRSPVVASPVRVFGILHITSRAQRTSGVSPKSRWDGVEADCRTVEGMALAAGSAGAQGALAAGRGAVASPSAESGQARSLTDGGLDEEPESLIAAR